MSYDENTSVDPPVITTTESIPIITTTEISYNTPPVTTDYIDTKQPDIADYYDNNNEDGNTEDGNNLNIMPPGSVKILITFMVIGILFILFMLCVFRRRLCKKRKPMILKTDKEEIQMNKTNKTNISNKMFIVNSEDEGSSDNDGYKNHLLKKGMGKEIKNASGNGKGKKVGFLDMKTLKQTFSNAKNVFIIKPGRTKVNSRDEDLSPEEEEEDNDFVVFESNEFNMEKYQIQDDENEDTISPSFKNQINKNLYLLKDKDYVVGDISTPTGFDSMSIINMGALRNFKCLEECMNIPRNEIEKNGISIKHFKNVNQNDFIFMLLVNQNLKGNINIIELIGYDPSNFNFIYPRYGMNAETYFKHNENPDLLKSCFEHHLFMIQAISGITQLHRMDIAHRNINLTNILIEIKGIQKDVNSGAEINSFTVKISDLKTCFVESNKIKNQYYKPLKITYDPQMIKYISPEFMKEGEFNINNCDDINLFKSLDVFALGMTINEIKSKNLNNVLRLYIDKVIEACLTKNHRQRPVIENIMALTKKN